MNLESLPNEILLHLFDCLDGIDLLHAFYGLNSRFNLLLYKQFRAYRFNFYSISKGKFDIICQQHLPFITDRVISLSLCDDSKTPEQTNLFFSYIPSLAQFTHLRFLTLPSLSSSEILMKIVNEFHHLNNLTHFELDYFKHEKDTKDYQLIVNNIWSLTKLTHCRLDIHIGIRNKFRLPTKISTSLKDLYISRFKLNYNQIHKLLDYTPHLKRLSIFIDFGTIEDYKPSPLPTLTI